MELKRIYDDLFHIAKRLKSIDKAYELYLNRRLKRFEIHARGAMQMALPFDKLDVRTLEYARKTRIENIENMIREIEMNNEKIQKQKEEEIVNSFLSQMEA